MNPAPDAPPISGAEIITGLNISGKPYPIDKVEAHRRNARHLAISVFVLDGDRLLLQQRAQGKYHSGGLWANTCCSHPRWNEAPAECAQRRLREEIGFSVALEEFASIEYAAPVGALFENEVVHCFRGRIDERIHLDAFDPSEVQVVAWRSLEEIAGDMARRPQDYAPWFHIYLGRHYDPGDEFNILA
jgi:isopentenyl-diphosphate delta-isomerase